MNHAKIAAALHALAEAFEGAVENIEQAATGKPAKVKAKVAAVDAAPAPAAPAVVTAAPVAVEPAPAVPSVTIAQVNKAVLAVAAKNRDGAIALLAKFGLSTTVGLAQDKWQAVYDAFEEEIAKMDAAAVQISQASLV